MEKVDKALAELSNRLKVPKAIQYLQEMTRMSATFKSTLKGVPALVEKRESARGTADTEHHAGRRCSGTTG